MTVVDAGDFRHGCSHGNAGMVVPSHFIPLAAPGMIKLGLKWMFNAESPFHLPFRFDQDLISWIWKFYLAANKKHVTLSSPLLCWLNLVSKQLFEEIAREASLDFGFRKNGLLLHCKKQKTLEKEASLVTAAHKLGIDAEVLSLNEVEKLDPGLQLDTAGAVYFPSDAFFTPQLFMSQLYQKLSDQGVSFVPSSQIISFSRNRGMITAAHTKDDSFVVDEYIIATGSWSARLCRDLSINLPLIAGKGYSVSLSQPKIRPNICSILTEARVAVTPMQHGLRFAGTMELGNVNENVNRRRLNGIFKSIPKYFPEFKTADFERLGVWTGLRPCSPDGLPYLGRPDNFKNLILATGHAMMGLSLGPVTGLIVSQIACGEKTKKDISILNPSRYD